MGTARLRPSQAIRLGWGFFRIGMGIALTLLLGGGAIQIAAWDLLPLPSFMLGLAFILWGLSAFWTRDPLTPNWTRLTRRTTWAGVLLTYFSPFTYWWFHHNHALYLTFNMICFCICLTALLIGIAQLAAETGSYCRDEMFRLESQISCWAVIILLGLPLLIAMFLGALFYLSHHSDPFSQWQKMYIEAPIWIRTFFLIPTAMIILTSLKAGFKFYKMIDASD